MDYRGTPPVKQVPNYPMEPDARAAAADECDRQISRGVLRPLAPGEKVLIVHPTIVVPQSDKWRYCVDCSVGINLGMAKLPNGDGRRARCL